MVVLAASLLARVHGPADNLRGSEGKKVQLIYGCCARYWECARAHRRRVYCEAAHGHVTVERKLSVSGEARFGWIGQCLHLWDIPDWWKRVDPEHGMQDHQYATLET